MELKLSENIRALRRQHSLTQEQLSQVMGVTVGAVHKWETGLSMPDIGLIVEMADFFDVSVDALLGYKLKDNRLSATTERLTGYLRSMNKEALTEAEKALKKYPYSFEIVNTCAGLYALFGSADKDKALLRRSLELEETALTLIGQNTDPGISESTINGNMAFSYAVLGEHEKAIELLKKHNVQGMYSDSIGALLVLLLKRPDEAEQYLSKALLRALAVLSNTLMGFAYVYDMRGDYDSMQQILFLEMELMRRLKQGDKADFLDKSCAGVGAALAYALQKTGQTKEARDVMRRAKEDARRFDAAPDYGYSTVKFASGTENSSAFDILGKTAVEGVENLLGAFSDGIGLALWKEISENEQ